MILQSEIGVIVIERSQPKGVKSKMRDHKLRYNVNCKGR